MIETIFKSLSQTTSYQTLYKINMPVWTSHKTANLAVIYSMFMVHTRSTRGWIKRQNEVKSAMLNDVTLVVLLSSMDTDIVTIRRTFNKCLMEYCHAWPVAVITVTSIDHGIGK